VKVRIRSVDYSCLFEEKVLVEPEKMNKQSHEQSHAFFRVVAKTIENFITYSILII